MLVSLRNQNSKYKFFIIQIFISSTSLHKTFMHFLWSMNYGTIIINKYFIVILLWLSSALHFCDYSCGIAKVKLFQCSFCFITWYGYKTNHTLVFSWRLLYFAKPYYWLFFLFRFRCWFSNWCFSRSCKAKFRIVQWIKCQWVIVFLHNHNYSFIMY